MTANVKDLLEHALTLPAEERATLVDELLASFEPPDDRIDALWAQEAMDRLAAYDAGKVQAIPAEAVLAEFEQA